MSVRLVCDVTVETWHVAGTFLVDDVDSELLSLLTCVVEHGGDLSAEELSGHLFGPGRTAIARQLLCHLTSLGVLWTPRPGLWAISVAGVAALQRRAVPRKEHEARVMVVVENSALGRRLVSSERAPAVDLHAVVHGRPTGDNRSRTRRGAAVATSDEFEVPSLNLLGASPGISLVPGSSVVARQVKRDPVADTLEIDLDSLPHARLVMGGTSHDAVLRPGEEDELRRTLARAGDSCPITERDVWLLPEPSVRSLTGLAPPAVVEVGNLGHFTLTGVEGSLAPVDAAAANSLALRRAVVTMDHYMSEEEWEVHAGVAAIDVSASDVDASDLDRANAAEVLRRLERPEPNERFLVAPLDWGL